MNIRGKVWQMVSVVLLACGWMSPASAVTLEMVTVGNAGNAADLTGYGAVEYEYHIGMYEVKIGQYTEFLNAAAKEDPHGLYNTDMADNLNIAGIRRSGSPGSYAYSVTGPNGIAPEGADSSGDRPIGSVNWFSAARFANWMHNGQGSGSTETGAYDLASAAAGVAPAKSPGAQFYIPTENEWYKAAYYSPGKGDPGVPGYYAYATQSDSAPGNALFPSMANQANYYAGDYSVTQSEFGSTNQNYLTNVGAFTNNKSFYGTFDQTGNVREWNDLDGIAQSLRGTRGGSYGAGDVASSFRGTSGPSYANPAYGFRLASPAVAVPEPSTWGLGLAGLACGGWQVFRRRKRVTPSPNPEPVLVRASSYDVWGPKGFFDEDATQHRCR